MGDPDKCWATLLLINMCENSQNQLEPTVFATEWSLPTEEYENPLNQNTRCSSRGQHKENRF
jgi:hypothetical protein